MAEILKELKRLTEKKSKRERLSAAAKEVWQSQFSSQRFSQLLADYRNMMSAHGQPTDPEWDRIFVELKEIRKAGQVLRSSFLVLDCHHEVPDYFAYFIWAMGQLKDNFGSPISLAYVTILEEALEQYDLLNDVHLDAADRDSLKFMVKMYADDVLKKLNQDVLTPEEFHACRKHLRHLVNIFILGLRLWDTKRVRKVRMTTKDLNDRLGEINDKLEENKIARIRSISHREVHLPAQLKEEILALFQ